MANLNEYRRLQKKYPYIAAFGRMLGSYDPYIERKLHEADLDNAPADAYSTDEDGNYKVITEVPHLQKALEEYVEDIKKM